MSAQGGVRIDGFVWGREDYPWGYMAWGGFPSGPEERREMEDRFMTQETMVAISRDLENAGFRHVTVAHLIDPKWRRDYRPTRPELDAVAWTIRLDDFMLPMDRVKRLIDVCERHGLVFWMTLRGAADETELYIKAAPNESAGIARSQSL